MKRITKYTLVLSLMMALSSCNKYLEIVPDNIAEIEMAFSMRETAQRYLATCYSHLPNNGDPMNGNTYPLVGTNPAFYAGLEAHHHYATLNDYMGNIPAGNQNVGSPIGSYFQMNRFWEGIRHCNILIENIEKVPDMSVLEKRRWTAEAKVIKVYLHFLMFQQVGPIPIVDTNLDLNSGADESRPYRQKVDDVINYIVSTIDAASVDLPDKIELMASEAGRISKIAALGIKAKVLLTAASPLCNGNGDYAQFLNEKGEPFFNRTYDPNKWVLAKNAAKAAIELAQNNGLRIFKYAEGDYPPSAPNAPLSNEIKRHLNLRGALTERFNSEVVWANPASYFRSELFFYSIPKLESRLNAYPSYSVSVNHALEYYSKNGVPIDEDIEWGYSGRFDVVNTGVINSLFVQNYFQILKLNLNREPRFYANLGFDGGKWYGQGRYDENNQYNVMVKKGDPMVSSHAQYKNETGYYPKKIIPWDYEIQNNGETTTAKLYAWPVIRLSDLYLSYAEALNEVEGPTNEVFSYIDGVRERAGLLGVKESWLRFSVNPGKPNTKEGLRTIIQKERRIEFGLEGIRFYDELRWKTAVTQLSGPVYGLRTGESSAASYNQLDIKYQRQFSTKDYLFPIGIQSIYSNRKLIQNPGW